MVSDPYFSQVSLLLHMDGSNGSTTFTDSSSNATTVTANGNARISTTNSKFGGSSLYCDGSTGTYLSFGPLNTSNLGGDLTLECWIYPESTADRAIFGDLFTSGNVQLLTLIGGNLIAYWNGVYPQGLDTTIATNTWTHVAVARESNTVRLFVNGVVVASAYGGGTYYIRPSAIGRCSYRNNFVGYIDEVRITEQVARYNSNFTPPTAPFPNSSAAEVDPYFSQVALLLQMAGSNNATTFTDSSPLALSATTYGDAKISTTGGKFGGNCGVFDGSGDYLIFPSSSVPRFTGDFTIETWAYPTNIDDRSIASGNHSQDSNIQLFRMSSNGSMIIYMNTNGQDAGTVITAPAGSVVANQWQHIALCRSGSNTRLFVNGVQVGSTNTSWTSALTCNVIGQHFFNGSAYSSPNQFAGKINEFRTTSAARYTSNFTPPTAAFPNTGPSIELLSLSVAALTITASELNFARTDKFSLLTYFPAINIVHSYYLQNSSSVYSITTPQVNINKTREVQTLTSATTLISSPELYITKYTTARFPSIKPTNSQYTEAKYPISRARSQNGMTYQRLWSTTAFDALLSLTFDNITDSEAQLISAVYDQTYGNFKKVELPSALFDGASTDLWAYMNAPGISLEWSFERPPTVRSVFAGLSDVSVQLKARKVLTPVYL